MFNQGFKPALKDICGYKFEQISDFDKLRVEIRKIKQDHLKPEEKVTHSISSVRQADEKSDIKEMKSMIKSLRNTVEQLEKRVNANQEFQGKNSQGYNTNIVVALIHKVKVTIIVGKSNHFSTNISVKVNLLDKE